MAQTLTSFYFHVVFATKDRIDIIRPDVENELYAYLGGILVKNKSKLLIGNGIQNHVHLLLSLNKNVKVPDLIGDIKRSSSKWIKTKGGMLTKFAWQDGYSAFTVGHTQLPDLKRYIGNQKEHHKNIIFEDEMRSFYRKYEMPFDEKYIWD